MTKLKNNKLTILILTAILTFCAFLSATLLLLPKDSVKAEAENSLEYITFDYGEAESGAEPKLQLGITFPDVENLTSLNEETNAKRLLLVHATNDLGESGLLRQCYNDNTYFREVGSYSGECNCIDLNVGNSLANKLGKLPQNTFIISGDDFSSVPMVEKYYGSYRLNISLPWYDHYGNLDISKDIYITVAIIYQADRCFKYWVDSKPGGAGGYDREADHEHTITEFDWLSNTVKIDNLTQTSLHTHLRKHILNYTVEEPWDVDYDCYNKRVQRYVEKYNSILNFSPEEEELDVSFTYKTIQDNDYANPVDVTEIYKIPSWAYLNKQATLYYLFLQTTKKDISDYNVVYYSNHSLENGEMHLLQERIILQAKAFNYDGNGQVTVEYDPYQYKEFHLRVLNNDDQNNLSLDIYTSRVQTNGSIVTLTFDFPTIQEQLFNTAGWLVQFAESEFTVTNNANNVSYEFIANGNIDEDDNVYEDLYLTVTFDIAYQNELSKLDILCVTKIVEDVEYSFSIEYLLVTKGTTGDLSLTTENRVEEPILYSRTLAFNFTNFMLYYGDFVSSAVTLTDGVYVATPKNVSRVYNHETKAFKIVVKYEYPTLFKITNNYNQDVEFKPISNTFKYFGSDFVSFVPDGWRVKTIIADSGKVRSSNLDTWEYEKFEFEVITSLINNEAPNIISVHVEYTDRFPIRFVYMSQYKQTPFAVKNEYRTEIRFADYNVSHPKGLTLNQVAQIIGVDVKSFEFLGVRVETSKISCTDWTNGEYVYDLSRMTHLNVLQRSSDGSAERELKVPLTTYSEWTLSFGQDWSILALNNSQNTYFKYSDEVEPHELYGFFTVAVFKEKVSNLNSWFSGLGSKGCFVEFESKEVRGSALYKFFGRMTDNFLGTGILGPIGMIYCELFNDENAVYYSYFFYLDGTSDLPFIGHNKGDDYDDDKSAPGNTLEDTGEKIGNTWDKIKDWFENSTLGTVLKIVFWVLVGAFGLWLLIKIIGWIRKAF